MIPAFSVTDKDPSGLANAVSHVISCGTQPPTRLVLCDYPVHPLSKMRRLQLQQKSQKQKSPLNQQERFPDSAWPGQPWLLHPLASLTGLESLELRLMQAPSDGGAVDAAAERASFCSGSPIAMAGLESPKGDDNGSYLEDDSLEDLLASQRTLLQSLTGLRSLASLSVNLVEGSASSPLLFEGGGSTDDGADHGWTDSDDVGDDDANEDVISAGASGSSSSSFGGAEIDHDEAVFQASPSGEHLLAAALTPSCTVIESGPSSQPIPVFATGRHNPPSAVIHTLAQLSSLSSLCLSRCNVPVRSLRSLCGSLHWLRNLTLLGVVELSHASVAGFSGMRLLEHLELSKVR